MKENELCVEFLGFVQIEKMDAQTIADKIISSVTRCKDRLQGRKSIAEFLRGVSLNIRGGQPHI